jgi:hypothetical protein
MEGVSHGRGFTWTRIRLFHGVPIPGLIDLACQLNALGACDCITGIIMLRMLFHVKPGEREQLVSEQAIEYNTLSASRSFS